MLVFLFFNEPIFAQSATIYGNTQVISGQTYTYEASVNATKYIWNISGGTIITNRPIVKTVEVIWDNNTAQGSISYETVNQNDTYQANLNVSITPPPMESCISHYISTIDGFTCANIYNACSYPICVILVKKFPNDITTSVIVYQVNPGQTVRDCETRRYYDVFPFRDVNMESYIIDGIYRCD